MANEATASRLMLLTMEKNKAAILDVHLVIDNSTGKVLGFRALQSTMLLHMF
jgi:hypothetical protein